MPSATEHPSGQTTGTALRRGTDASQSVDLRTGHVQRAATVTPGASPSAPRSAFQRVAGLVLVVIAAYVGTMEAKTWNTWVSFGVKTDAQSTNPSGPGAEIAQPRSPGRGTADSATGLDRPVVRKWPWLGWCLVLISATGAMSLIRSKPVSLLITTVSVAAAIYGAAVLLGGDVSWRLVVFIAAVLGYLIHSVPRPAPPSLRGVVALGLVIAAGVGAAEHWYDWTPVASKLGPGPTRFVSEWGEELAWLTVLLLTLAGVVCSRTKPIHFLIAVLLVILASHCVTAGRTEIRSFPGLSEPGGPLISQPDISYSNVEAWRWVTGVELVLISAVLLYRSTGMGSLNVAFALAWMCLGCGVYDSIRSLSFVASMFHMAAPPNAADGGDRGLETQVPGDPLVNWGLPLGSSAPPRRSGPRARLPAAGSAGASPADRVARGIPATVATIDEIERAKRAALESLGAARGNGQAELTWREAVLPVWMYLTAILAGAIAVSGFRMLPVGEGPRAWLSYALWLAFGITLAAIWLTDPKEPAQSWTSWISDWTQSKYKLHVVWAIFVGTMAVAGSWASRSKSRAEHWVRASITCIFIGTALTLIAVALLIYHGGFSPLPVWTYAAIAAGQSSLAWILMMYLNLTARRSRAGPASP